MDCSLSCSSVPGIVQARILEWVAIPFSGDLPDPGIKSGSPALQVDSFLTESPGKSPGKKLYISMILLRISLKFYMVAFF